MSLPLFFRREAEIDLTDIEDYYTEVSIKIRNGFFDEFFRTINFIEQNPKLYQVRYREIRIAPLYRFPYGIHYRITDEKVIIFRVLHTKRYFK